MQLPISIRSVKEAPLQHQLTEQVRGLIAQGVLLPGMQIPSTRELAEQLGVSRRTVVLSYERLISDGFIETRPAAGTFVCDQLPHDCIRVPTQPADAASPEASIPRRQARATLEMQLYQAPSDRLPYDFRIGRPDPDLFPRKIWRRLISEQLDTFSRRVGDYTDPSGHPLLRQAIARHLRTARAIACQPEQIVITAGAQEGLNLIGRLMKLQGERVVVEDPCYQGAAHAFLDLGADLEPVPVTGDGLDTDRLPHGGATLAYVTPSHQFPLGVTMSQARRKALIAWARRTGALIVEDDYDSDFRHNSSPIAALQALGPECVAYIGTFSKSVGPGLRLGYVVFPEHLADAARALKSITSNGHPWLEQSVMAQFISTGMFEQHLGRMRTTYLQRRNALMEELDRCFPETSVSGYEGGMHLVWSLTPELPTALALQNACKDRGVGVYSLRQSPTFQVRPNTEHVRLVLLGYACLGTDKIVGGIGRIEGMIQTDVRTH
jgi:GntR family transcriptional regulator/MocR family aminotransferase